VGEHDLHEPEAYRGRAAEGPVDPTPRVADRERVRHRYALFGGLAIGILVASLLVGRARGAETPWDLAEAWASGDRPVAAQVLAAT
jgi:hypothetical protein